VKKWIDRFYYILIVFMCGLLYLNFDRIKVYLASVPGGPYEYLTLIFIWSGLFIAWLNFRKFYKNSEIEEKQKTSKFFCEEAQRGLSRVSELLKDGNNDREIWVYAARILIESKNLAKNIILEEYQLAYGTHADKIRHELYLILSFKNEATGEREDLPPHFFFGHKEWKTDWLGGLTLEDLQDRFDSIPIQSYSDGWNIMPKVKFYEYLPPKSFCVIFDFLKYSEDYIDPLDQVKVWKVSDYFSIGRRAGPERYLRFKERFRRRKFG